MMSHEQLVQIDQQKLESKLFAVEKYDESKSGDVDGAAEAKPKLRPKPTMALLEFPEELPGTSVIRRSKTHNANRPSQALVKSATGNDATPRSARGADRLGPQLWKNDLGEGVEMTPRTARSEQGESKVDYQALAKQRPKQASSTASAERPQFQQGSVGAPVPSLKRVGGGFAQSVPTKQSVPTSTTTVQPLGMPSQQDLVSAITVALKSALPSIMGNSASGSGDMNQDLIGLGLGLGLGLGMRQQGLAASGSVPPVSNDVVKPSADDLDNFEDDKPSTGEQATEAEEKEKEAAALALMLTPTPDTIENDTHAAAGKGTTHHRLTKEDNILPLVKSKPDLPENFLTAVFEPHVGKQYVDYLPNEPNMNEATYCAAVRPRNMMEDWLETGFDPWAEGRDPTATDFRKHLPGEDSDGEDDNPFADKRGVLERKLKVEADAKVSEIMDQIMSLSRHGRYDEIDEIVSSPDFVHSIDSKDSKGNTLLLSAAQNGNKRIAKLALRKGADINLQNLTGQTALHFAFSYGYEELGNYLISKGADDSIVNAEGLTCYEGLTLQALDNL